MIRYSCSKGNGLKQPNKKTELFHAVKKSKWFLIGFLKKLLTIKTLCDSIISAKGQYKKNGGKTMKKEKVREAKKLIANDMEETDKMKKVLAKIKELKK